MKWNDIVSEWKMYAQESMRLFGMLTFITSALVLKQVYHIEKFWFVLVILIGGVFFLLLGKILVSDFKEGEQKKLFDKTPQIKEIQDSLKRIENKLGVKNEMPKVR